MVAKGTVLRNGVTKEMIEFLETRDSSKGKHTKVKWTLQPGGVKPAVHIHQVQDEVFEVLSGSYTYEMNGEKRTLRGGESVSMPMAVAHTHYSDDQGVTEVIQTVSPALDFEDLLARIFEIFNEGNHRNGEPPLLEVMVWIKQYESKTYLAKMPIGMQNAMATLLAPIGKMLGHGGK